MNRLPLGVFWILVAFTHLIQSVSAESKNKVPFSDVWRMILKHSPQIQAFRQDLESARISEKRASLHRYPRVFMSGRIYSTNDSASTFTGGLGQRQIIGSDFVPATLNQPGSSFFQYGTLGFDLPVYEGGSKAKIAESLVKRSESKALQVTAAKIAQYAELAQNYGMILSLRREEEQLKLFGTSVDRMILHYKIGSKSNPIGYSGLLGLKNTRNRIQERVIQISGKSSALSQGIRILAQDLPENWLPLDQRVTDFISRNFMKLNTNPSVEMKPTVGVQAMNLETESLEKMIDSEKGRLFPRVGLYGSGDVFGGNRGLGASYSGGAYVQWDLFSAQNFDAVAQAVHTSAASQARAEEMNERNHIEKSSAIQSAQSLEQNLALMEESDQWLKEQFGVAQELFKNGSINALQLVEVIQRRIDLLVSRTEAEMSLTQARATLIVHSGAEGIFNEN